MYTISLQRISADDRAEEIFRDAYPGATGVPRLDEIVVVRMGDDRDDARRRVVADLDRVAPDESHRYLAVREG